MSGLDLLDGMAGIRIRHGVTCDRDARALHAYALGVLAAYVPAADVPDALRLVEEEAARIAWERRTAQEAEDQKKRSGLVAKQRGAPPAAA